MAISTRDFRLSFYTVIVPQSQFRVSYCFPCVASSPPLVLSWAQITEKAKQRNVCVLN